MSYFSTETTLGQVFANVVKKAEEAGYHAIKIPVAKNIRMTAANTVDKNGITHTITASVNGSSNPAFYAMQKNNGTSWYGNTSATGVSTLQYDFGVGNMQTVNAYSLMSRNGDPKSTSSLVNAPKQWVLEGSNDNTKWTTLDRQENETAWRNSEKRYYAFENNATYRYYKLTFTESNGSTLHLNGWDLFNLNDLKTRPDKVSAAYLISNGTSSTDNVNLYIDAYEFAIEDDSIMHNGNSLLVGTVEKFDPKTFKQSNMYVQPYYTARTTVPYQNHPDVYVNLHIDINKDRIFFATMLDQAAVNTATNACYLGLIKRHSDEGGGNDALTVAVGMYAQSSNPTVLRARSGAYYSSLTPVYVAPSQSPSVWGDNIFVSPVFLEGAGEGIRGEYDDVYTCRTDSLVNEDEVLIGEVRYKIILITSYGSCNFPYYCAVLKMGS